MSALIVVSHPDDEVLGCGGVAWRFAQAGRAVHSCILSGNVEVRTRRPTNAQLADDLGAAHQQLGIDQIILGDFPNIALNTVAHVDLVRFVEDAIARTRPSVIFTHHPNDLNNDHRQTALACLAASRLAQRRAGIPHMQAVYLMEILSSTDWAFPAAHELFQPTTFCEIGEHGLAKKLAALECYRNVMRPYPHSRSVEAVRALATLRGAQSGLVLAEAFQLVYARNPLDGGDAVIP